MFAGTLMRLYPNTPQRIADEVARIRCPLECAFDPVASAEDFALTWGPPVRVENATPKPAP